MVALFFVERPTSNVANASKRGQRLLAVYAEREHFRADAVWSNVSGAPIIGAPENLLGRLGNLGRLRRVPIYSLS